MLENDPCTHDTMTYECVTQKRHKVIGYEPAGLTVHPPPPE